MSPSRVARALVGLESGVLGGVAALVFLVLTSVMERHAWWAFPNLIGVVFYGGRALHSGPGWATISGASLHVLVAGLTGLSFGILFGKVAGAMRATLLGVVWSLTWFYVGMLASRRWVPLVAFYMPLNAAMASYALQGLFLGRVARRIKPAELHPEPAPSMADSSTEEDGGVKSD